MSNPAQPDSSLEDAIAELEQVVRTLEDGTTSLDAALAAYERGVGILKCCYQHLRLAEQRILKLTGSDGGGRPTLELFQHTAAVEAEQAESRASEEASGRCARLRLTLCQSEVHVGHTLGSHEG